MYTYNSQNFCSWRSFYSLSHIHFVFFGLSHTTTTVLPFGPFNVLVYKRWIKGGGGREVEQVKSKSKTKRNEVEKEIWTTENQSNNRMEIRKRISMREMYKRNFILLQKIRVLMLIDQMKEAERERVKNKIASTWKEEQPNTLSKGRQKNKMKQIAFDAKRGKHFNNRMMKIGLNLVCVYVCVCVLFTLAEWRVKTNVWFSEHFFSILLIVKSLFPSIFLLQGCKSTPKKPHTNTRTHSHIYRQTLMLHCDKFSG